MDRKFSWEQITQLSKELAQKIKESGFKPDCLIGVAIGGLIPLGLLAQELNVGNVLIVGATSYTGKEQGKLKINYLPEADLAGKKILLVDEVSETGKTLQGIVAALKKKYHPGELRTATLAVNIKTSKFRPDFCPLEVEEWTIFPWEKE